MGEGLNRNERVIQLLQGYRRLAVRDNMVGAHIVWMCDTLIAEVNSITTVMSAEKFNRWMGFIQGYLATRGLRSIDSMREDVRHALALDKPATGS